MQKPQGLYSKQIRKKEILVYFSLPRKVSICVGKFQQSFIYFTLGNSGKLIVLFYLG